MILMSDDLAGRLDESIVNDDISDELTLQIKLDNLSYKFGVLSASICEDSISLTFKTSGSTAFDLMSRRQEVVCYLLCGSKVIDFPLTKPTVTWDNTEGKQLCTIVTILDSARGVTNE